MLYLKDYLKVELEKNKFSLPFTFFQNIKFVFTTKFLEFLPMSNDLIIDNQFYDSFYWENIFEFIKKEFKATYIRENRRIKSHFFSKVVSLNILGENKLSYIRGNGCHSDSWDIANSKAVGEFLERYSSSIISESQSRNFFYLKFKNFKESVVNLRNFHNFFDEKLIPENYKIDDEDKFLCVNVEDLITKNKIPCPVHLLYWGNKKNEKSFLDLTTSGCAGGFDLEQATTSAILENVERDSFFCFWLTQTSPDIIKIPPGIIDSFDSLQRKLTNLDFSFFVLNTTSDLGIPSITCVSLNNKTNGIVVSGGAGINFYDAISSACNEMLICMIDEYDENYFSLPEDYKPFQTKGINRKERLSLWRSGKYKEKINFFIGGKEINFENLEPNIFQSDEKSEVGALNYLVDKLNLNGLNVYRYEFKNKYLYLFNFFIVRVYIPKLFPLYLAENIALVKSERLEIFNKKNNKKPNFVLNTFPHPFP